MHEMEIVLEKKLKRLRNIIIVLAVLCFLLAEGLLVINLQRNTKIKAIEQRIKILEAIYEK